MSSYSLFTTRSVCRILISNRWLRNKQTARCIHCSRPLRDEEKDEPFKYSTSKAAVHQELNFAKPRSSAPWYQPYIISASVAVFLIYFCILREENDLDEQMDKSLYDTVEGLEETHLKQYIRYCIENNKPTDMYEKRLIQLMKEREARQNLNNASGQV